MAGASVWVYIAECTLEKKTRDSMWIGIMVWVGIMSICSFNNTICNETEKILNSINIVTTLSCEVTPGEGIQLVTFNNISGSLIQEWDEMFKCRKTCAVK